MLLRNASPVSRTALGDPGVHAQALGRGALLVVHPCGTPRPSAVLVEVWLSLVVLLAVTALIRATGGAQAVGWGAAHVLPGARRVLAQRRASGLGHETRRAPRGGSAMVPRRRDGLRFDVDIMVGADRQVGTLRYVIPTAAVIQYTQYVVSLLAG